MQLIQEYFAARQLVAHPEPERAAVNHLASALNPTYHQVITTLEAGVPVPNLPTTGWEETMILAAEMTAEPEILIRELISLNLPLAGRCASGVDLPKGLKRELQGLLLARMADDQYDLRSRFGAGLVLGELGDSRFTDHGGYILPPFVPIECGQYRLGDGSHGDERFENLSHSVMLDRFEMAVFPVTNAEYHEFIEVGGYENEAFWDTAGAKMWLRGESTANARHHAQLELERICPAFRGKYPSHPQRHEAEGRERYPSILK